MSCSLYQLELDAKLLTVEELSIPVIMTDSLTALSMAMVS